MSDGVYPITIVIDTPAPRKECSHRPLVEHSLMIYKSVLTFLCRIIENHQKNIFVRAPGRELLPHRG